MGMLMRRNRNKVVSKAPAPEVKAPEMAEEAAEASEEAAKATEVKKGKKKA